MLADLKRSQQSVKDFAQEHGLIAQRLYGWRRRLGEEGASIEFEAVERPMDLVPVRVRDDTRFVSHPETVAIRVHGRAMIEVSSSISPAWVASLVRELEEGI